MTSVDWELDGNYLLRIHTSNYESWPLFVPQERKTIRYLVQIVIVTVTVNENLPFNNVSS